MKIEAELTDRDTILIAVLDIHGKPLVIEKTLAANEARRLRAAISPIAPGQTDET